jgi:hypothetical protein
MPLEAKPFRHRVIPIPEGLVGDIVTARPRQQRAQAPQLGFVQDECGFSWHGRQLVDSRLRFPQVCVL